MAVPFLYFGAKFRSISIFLKVLKIILFVSNWQNSNISLWDTFVKYVALKFKHQMLKITIYGV